MKNAVYYFQISIFVPTNQILIICNEERYLSQFASEIFDSLQ